MTYSVVLIEDDESLAHAIQAMLETQGAHVKWYSDAPPPGTLRAAPPDLMVLDCILGTTSGPDYLEQLRAEPGMANLPVIMTTGYHELSEQLRELESPRLALLEKPFTAEALATTTQRLLGRPVG